MAINRIAYFAQSGVIQTNPNAPLSGGGSGAYMIPINSANIEVTRPVEALTAFGQFAGLNEAQTNITTCKCSLKGYLGTGVGFSGVDSNVLNDIISTTQTGTIIVNVSPQGFSMTGICTNIGLDIAVGGFGMFDMGFAGVGNPSVANAQTSATVAASTSLALSPVTTMSIGTAGLLSGVSATSIKFSYDLPTDTLTSLGENPNATQGSLNSIIATKAPYKATMSVEGFGVNPTLADASIPSGVSIGNINVVLPHGKVSARSFNNAAGQASATFSYTAEDVSATLSVAAVGSYVQNNTALGSPTWGA